MIILARVVRKVSNKNLANANKNKKLNKWFIGGIITGVVVGIALAIILWVTLGKNDDTNKVDYFNTYEITENGTTTEVKFTKANYSGLLNVLDDTYSAGYVEEGITIVFAYNSDTFNPENEDDEEAAKLHAKLLEYIADIQLKVNEAKEVGVKVELYIVDICISSDNWDIMGDSNFGGNTTVSNENVNSVSPLLAYIDNGTSEKLNKKCSKNKINEIISTAVPNILAQLQSEIDAK
jgi:hypothetical protein